jgi:hypothetical protein
MNAELAAMAKELRAKADALPMTLPLPGDSVARRRDTESAGEFTPVCLAV